MVHRSFTKHVDLSEMMMMVQCLVNDLWTIGYTANELVLWVFKNLSVISLLKKQQQKTLLFEVIYQLAPMTIIALQMIWYCVFLND